VTFTLIFNKTERDKIGKFGCPELNMGGTFDGFTLPDSYKKLTEFPLTITFDGIELGSQLAETRAIAYRVAIQERLRVLWTDFKAIPDNFGDEHVTTI
jgi:hypothetical protein